MTTDESVRKEVPEEIVAAGAVVNVAEHLRGLEFPATVKEVEEVARRSGADESAMEEIRKLPADRTFASPTELIAAIGDEVKGL